LAAECLYHNGHKNVMVLTGRADSEDSRLREKEFKKFYADKGIVIPDSRTLSANFEEEDAYRLTAGIDFKKEKVTAVFCCNDNMALGVLRRLKEAGLSCPGDVSVVGYDDIYRARHAQPALTTVQAPISELGDRAVRILLEFLRGEYKGIFYQDRTVLPVSLIQRASVRNLSC
jgi:DNA-binding LacI/PurR family transcriptional regulator